MNVPAPIHHVCQTLRAAGFEAWLVGGAVRDSLMGREAHDWDIASNAAPADVTRLFPESAPIGGHCGTVAVKLDGESYEVTPFRSDGAYTDGRHPDSVRFVSTIEEDLARRDFTMNAVAYDPIGERWCDPFGGRADIEGRWLCAVGTPADRFNEDGLRLLRAVRFMATHELQPSKSTGFAIEGCSENLRRIAPERIHDELFKMMGASRPSVGVEAMLGYGLLLPLVPEFQPLLGCTQNRWHRFDVWTHSMLVLDAVPASDPVLRFAGLFHDIAKPQTKGVHPVTGDATFYNHEEVGAEVTDGILQRLKFSNDERDRIVHHVRHHLIPYEPGWTAASIRRWVRRVGAGNVKSLCELGRADLAGKGTELAGGRGSALDELEERIANMTIHQPIATATSQLAISGGDVMLALGLGPGPAVGAKLRELLDYVTDHPEANTREALLAALAAK